MSTVGVNVMMVGCVKDWYDYLNPTHM